MPDKDPTNWGVGVWMLAIGMSLAGGMVSWYSKAKTGRPRVFNVIEFAIELLISGFVGLCVFMALDALKQPLGICAALAGIGGHMSTPLLRKVERAVEPIIDKILKGK